MNVDLLFQQQEQNEDLAEEFSNYTTADLHANLEKLIQTNIVYSYCESLIVEDLDYDFDMKAIINYYRIQQPGLRLPKLPCELLFKLKTIENEIKENDWSRQDTIALILNLIIENTLLHSTLTKFVDSK